MNLHLLPDSLYSEWFIQSVRENPFGSCNKFVISVDKENSPLRYVKDAEAVAVVPNTAAFYEKIGDFRQYRKVIIHYFSSRWDEFVLRLPAEVEVHMIAWGAEYYEPIEMFLDKVHDEFSLRYLSRSLRNELSGYNPIDWAKYVKRLYLRSPQNFIISNIYKLRLKSLSKVKTLYHFDSKYDAARIRENYKSLTAETKPFFYLNESAFQKADYTEVAELKKKLNIFSPVLIQVGHSSSPSGNHYEVLQWLSKFSSEDFQVICPLSYGDTNYRDAIISEGKRLLGDKFVPLTDLLSRPLYYGLLNDVRASIFGFRWAEGWGNINYLLNNGSKVILRDENPLYHFAKDVGYTVFNINNFTDSHSNVFESLITKLSEEQKTANKQVFQKCFSKEMYLQYLDELLN